MDLPLKGKSPANAGLFVMFLTLAGVSPVMCKGNSRFPLGLTERAARRKSRNRPCAGMGAQSSLKACSVLWQGFGDDFDVHVAGAAGDVDRTEHLGFAGNDDGSALQFDLTDDRIPGGNGGRGFGQTGAQDY